MLGLLKTCSISRKLCSSRNQGKQRRLKWPKMVGGSRIMTKISCDIFHRRIRCQKKAVKEIFRAGIKNDDKHQHQVLNKFNLKKAFLVFSWVSRFISNCRINNTQETKQGPIVTEDIVAQLLKIIKQYQLEFNLGGDFQKESLNLQMHELVCVSWQNQGRLSIIYTKNIIASITVG